MMIKKIFDFLGLLSTLAVISCGFYFATNNYFVVAGKMIDFSLYAWGLMFLLWSISGYQVYAKSSVSLLQFMFFAAITAMAFDLYRFFAGNGLAYYQVFLYAMLLFGIISFYLKRWFLVKLSLAAFFLIFFVFYFVTPQVFVYTVMGGMAFIWLLAGQKEEQSHRFVWLNVAWLLLVSVIVGVIFYLRLDGIRFYERPVSKTSENIKVSVIVPAYNAEKNLERCLDSLRKQSLKDIEIIVVDDGSIDKTADIVARYAAHDKRIKVIRQENAYVGAARNKGMSEARGEYIGFVDSDDKVSLDYYENLYALAKKNNAEIVAVGNVILHQASKDKFHPMSIFFASYDVVDDLAFYRTHVYGYAYDKIYKKTFLDEHRILFSTRRTNAEDQYFTTQALMWADKVYISHGAEAYYYCIADSHLTSAKNYTLNDDVIGLFLDLNKLVKEADLDEIKKQKWLGVVKKIRRFCFRSLYVMLSEDDKKEALKRFNTAFPDDKFDFVKKK